MSNKNIAISFENVSKMYRLGLVGTGTLGQDINRWWKMNILHQEDPYLKIGQTNDRSTKGTSDFVYALKDIDFQVEQGDVLGIIGKNGAGKSTLLKLLSRITAPTTGQIKTRGRLASLLEVGTGFHPELTGRENIYMNGSIMGMTKAEITRKLDEIIDFAGVERYIDTPCKRYSSGMQVRLGFAVAAFLEPEILVVDEVLAVGDAEFQKKAIGKMKDVSQGGGRTVLFVSHNMASMRRLCKNGILLENGQLRYAGDIRSTIEEYMQSGTNQITNDSIINLRREGKCNRHIQICDLEFLDEHDNKITPHCGQYLKIRIFFNVRDEGAKKCSLSFGVRDDYGNPMISLQAEMTQNRKDLDAGFHVADCIIKKFPITAGRYRAAIWAGDEDGTSDYLDNNIPFVVEDDDFFGIGKTISSNLVGKVVLVEHKWIF